MTDLTVKVRLTGEAGQLVGQLGAVAGAEANVAKAAKDMGAAAAQAAAQTDRLDAAGRRAANGLSQATKGMGAARSASANLGFQIQDITQSLALGMNPMMVFGQQAGQTAAAVSGMGGVVGTVGRYLAGPWGSIILAAITVTGMFATTLMKTSEAADEVKFSSYALGDAQSILGGIMDLTTGKINKQSDALKGLAIAQAYAGQVKAEQVILDSQIALSSLAASRGSIGNNNLRGTDAVAGIASATLDGSLNTSDSVRGIKSLGKTGFITKQESLDILKVITDKAVAEESLKLFESTDRMIEGRGTAADRALLLKPKTGSKKGDGNEAEKLATFGAKAAESITKITEQFDTQPKLVDRVNQSTRELNRIIVDLNEKQPKGFKDMIAAAVKAKGVVSDALLGPFNDYIQSAQRAQQLQSLQLAGRDDEARALQQIFQLESQVGAVSAEQRETILDTVTAERKINEQLTKRAQLISAYTSSISAVRGDLEQLLGGSLSGGDFLNNFTKTFQQLQGKLLTEQIFGPALDQLETYVKEQTGIQTSVDIMKAGTTEAGKAAGDMADKLEAAAQRIAALYGISPSGSVAGSSGAGGDLFAQFDSIFGLSGGAPTDGPAAETADNTAAIVVTAEKMAKGALALNPVEFFRKISDVMVAPIIKGLGLPEDSRLGGVLGGFLTGKAVGGTAGGLLGGLSALGLGRVSGFAGDALGGLNAGAMVASMFGGSRSGAGIGGAIGSVIPGIGGVAGGLLGSVIGGGNSLNKGIGALVGGGLAATLGTAAIAGAAGSVGGGAALGAIGGPVGIIAGAILGALLGGLVHKAKYGNAVFNAGQQMISSNSSGLNQAAGAAGNDVTTNLKKIADAFGGSLGAFNVSIGQTDGKWRVSSTGRSGELKSKYSDVQVFGTGEEAYAAALKAALADAIGDGAVQGLSAAVTRALQSSTDLDTAMAEAAKVKELEGLLGGFTGAATAAFTAFETQAKERLRLATTYGLELNKVEELNAKERLAVRAKLEAQAFGSLQDLLDRMNSGDLFEGSSVDKRAALLAKIETAKADAAAGVDGASDKLANLLDELNTVSKAVYGTTGGFASDRTSIQDTASGVIGLLRSQLDSVDPNVEKTNALLNENNDQNAAILVELQRLNLLGGTTSSNGSANNSLSISDVAAMAYTSGSWLNI